MLRWLRPSAFFFIILLLLLLFSPEFLFCSVFAAGCFRALVTKWQEWWSCSNTSVFFLSRFVLLDQGLRRHHYSLSIAVLFSLAKFFLVSNLLFSRLAVLLCLSLSAENAIRVSLYACQWFLLWKKFMSIIFTLEFHGILRVTLVENPCSFR